MALTFIEFDLQPLVRGQCLDYVAIEMHQNRGDPVLVCGNASELPMSKRSFESMSNKMKVTFHSDYAIEGLGFMAFFTAAHMCLNESYYQDNGTITSINYPANYLNNQECYVSIRVTNPHYVVEIEFEMLHTEAKLNTYLSDSYCDKDYVEILDAHLKYRRCGNWDSWSGRGNKLKFRSISSSVIIRFVSDSQGTAPGYKAVWRAVVNDTSLLPCPDGWKGFLEYCFQVQAHNATWWDAKEDCERKDSFLASVTSSSFNTFINSLIKNRSVILLSHNCF